MQPRRILLGVCRPDRLLMSLVALSLLARSAMCSKPTAIPSICRLVCGSAMTVLRARASSACLSHSCILKRVGILGVAHRPHYMVSLKLIDETTVDYCRDGAGLLSA